MSAVHYFMVLAGLLLVIGIVMTIQNNRIPSGLGVADGKLALVPSSPNAVSSQTDDVQKKVEPLPFRGNIIETKKALLAAFQQYGGANLIEEKNNYIHVVVTTGIMHYKDDVECYFDEKQRLVHYRSASRVGYSDMGLNKKRYEKVREIYLSLPEK